MKIDEAYTQYVLYKTNIGNKEIKDIFIIKTNGEEYDIVKSNYGKITSIFTPRIYVKDEYEIINKISYIHKINDRIYEVREHNF